MQTAEPSRILELHLHRLLVAVDDSRTADLALSAAVTASRRDHAAITLLAVVPNLVAEAGRWIVTAGAPDPAALQDEADAEGQRILRETAARIPDDIPVTTIIRHGKPGPEIVAEAADRDYDAILVGARGVGRVGALLGSVSAYVVGHAGTAVFVAHAAAAEELSGRRRLRGTQGRTTDDDRGRAASIICSVPMLECPRCGIRQMTVTHRRGLWPPRPAGSAGRRRRTPGRRRRCPPGGPRRRARSPAAAGRSTPPSIAARRATGSRGTRRWARAR